MKGENHGGVCGFNMKVGGDQSFIADGDADIKICNVLPSKVVSELNGRVLLVQPSHETVELFFSMKPQCDDVVNVPPPHVKVNDPRALVKNVGLQPANEDI